MKILRVLIVGGGFGGLYAALEFEKRRDPDVEVTLISREILPFYAHPTRSRGITVFQIADVDSTSADGTLFKPTLWAVASWLIFYVAHSLRIDLDMLVVTASPARTALKISQLTDGGMPPTYDSMH
jgi:hypothetical protein